MKSSSSRSSDSYSTIRNNSRSHRVRGTVVIRTHEQLITISNTNTLHKKALRRISHHNVGGSTLLNQGIKMSHTNSQLREHNNLLANKLVA